LTNFVQEGEAIVTDLFILDHDQSPTPIIAMAAISNFLFRHLTFLLLFPFYDPNTVNLHVLMVLSIGEIINAMLLPVALIVHFCSNIKAFNRKSIIFVSP
jgi:hypothetical protein